MNSDAQSESSLILNSQSNKSSCKSLQKKIEIPVVPVQQDSKTIIEEQNSKI